ncbi:ogr/Delta-like zinc finger family protein [Methylomonas sp. EFPC3]|uniref:ogr/Delta-like zinc finger family protein n=1 Tax=Methylomonas sp. EFPC3 TaxID=3021710 RepID=UPI0024169BE8|nr:ogr/Delta-like zinc finger family protein [Methylomonas sp. EFPC3]WFP48533.1 ogr/Delta-like zinc finger family protein [Methylomonas sp. EFPC3]
MKVQCPHCLSKARITSRNEITTTVADLYCQCMNTQACGASFVMTLGFSRYLNPPLTSTQRLAAHIIGSLTKAQRQELLQGDLFH